MRTRSAFFATLFFVGCSTIIDHRIHEPVSDCLGVDPGTPCVGGDYCYADQCRYSFCGDGVLNANRGEECDDGNLVAGDGCEPTSCRHTCDGDTPCVDDANACNGPESCIATTHRCVSGPEPAPGLACDTPGGHAGSCSQTYCVPAGCGNGIVDPTSEECEPPAAGCMVNCQWECESDVECPMSDPCVETRHCDVANHACLDDGPLSCDDADDCTADSCSSGLGGCNFAPIDADGDGFAPLPLTCSPTSTLQSNDCDDSDAFQNPFATEIQNGEDDDCDGETDEGTGTIVCYRDFDGDLYGDQNDATDRVTECPSGYVPERADGFDCADRNETVNPGLRPGQFFETPYCLGTKPPTEVSQGVWQCSDGTPALFDYDCDGEQEPRSKTVITNCVGNCGTSGWTPTAPECGVTGTWLMCGNSTGSICPASVGDALVQACR